MIARLLAVGITLLAGSMPSRGFALDSLVGTTYHQPCRGCEGWTGLPAGVRDTWGSLIDEGIDQTQFFGVQGFQTDDGRSFVSRSMHPMESWPA